MHRITGRRSPSLLRIPGRRALVGAAVACVAALAVGGTAVADVIFTHEAPFTARRTPTTRSRPSTAR